MFERYTEKARRSIFFGRYEASELGSPYFETEHLLLGLLREEKCLAAEILRERGLTLAQVRQELQGSSSSPTEP
jgi:ATP-dependent Clp protease ATP-binding subunit ClpC